MDGQGLAPVAVNAESGRDLLAITERGPSWQLLGGTELRQRGVLADRAVERGICVGAMARVRFDDQLIGILAQGYHFGRPAPLG